MPSKRTERSLLDELHGWAEREEQRAHNLGRDGAHAEYWRGQERAFRQVCEKVKAITFAEDRRRETDEFERVDSSPLPANPSKDVIADELRKAIVDIWRCWQRADSIEERIGDLEDGANTTDAAIARLEDLMVGVCELLFHHRLLTGEWTLDDEFINLQHDVQRRGQEPNERGTVGTVSVCITEEPRLHSASGGEGNE